MDYDGNFEFVDILITWNFAFVGLRHHHASHRPYPHNSVIIRMMPNVACRHPVWTSRSLGPFKKCNGAVLMDAGVCDIPLERYRLQVDPLSIFLIGEPAILFVSKYRTNLVPSNDFPCAPNVKICRSFSLDDPSTLLHFYYRNTTICRFNRVLYNIKVRLSCLRCQNWNCFYKTRSSVVATGVPMTRSLYNWASLASFVSGELRLIIRRQGFSWDTLRCWFDV